MAKTAINTVLSRIEVDLVTLRSLLDAGGSPPANIKGKVVKAAPSRNAAANVAIPFIEASYTEAQAVKAKAQIDAAFEAGLVLYDKKRGMKMMVTKNTEGWSPT